LGDAELAYVTDAVRSGWISSAGRYIERFEQGWAAYCGRRHGIAVANGTVALELAVAALDLRPGDEVIMPSFTIVSCALSVVHRGGTPVLVDSEPDTWCMDVEQVGSKIGPRTRAIMPVHIYGHPVDLDPVLELAASADVAVIEDAAEAHGAEYLSGREGDSPSWRRCGSFGELSCFSFYANKIVTTGEGGMVMTDDDAMAERLRSLRNLAHRPGARFHHDALGFNFRLTNLQAAIGVGQLERVDAAVRRKREIGRRYTERLARVSGLLLPVERPWVRNVYWMYGVVLDDSFDVSREDVQEELARRGIETRTFFVGLHEQPALRGRALFEGESYPVAERIGRRGFYLPSGVGLLDEEIDAVCAAVEEVLA
jgi:perosamine synthetase